jgi:hypothetical protein
MKKQELIANKIQATRNLDYMVFLAKLSAVILLALILAAFA